MTGLVVNSYAGGYSPALEAGLLAWWDFSEPGALTISGGIVEARDRGPSGYHLGQNVAGSRPAASGAINGRQAMRVDGASFLYRNDALGMTGAPAMTVFVVEQLAAGAAVDTGAGSRLFYFGAATSTQDRCVSVGSGQGGHSFRFNAGAQFFDHALTNGPRIDVFRRGVNARYDAGSMAIGGVDVASTGGANPSKVPALVDELTGIGTGFGGAGFASPNPFYGDIGEVIVLDRVLSAAAEARVGVYLGGKWGGAWTA